MATSFEGPATTVGSLTTILEGWVITIEGPMTIIKSPFTSKSPCFLDVSSKQECFLEQKQEDEIRAMWDRIQLDILKNVWMS